MNTTNDIDVIDVIDVTDVMMSDLMSYHNSFSQIAICGFLA